MHKVYFKSTCTKNQKKIIVFLKQHQQQQQQQQHKKTPTTAIGLARGGAVGAPAPPWAVKKNFVRRNLQGKCVSAPPQNTKCTL